MFFGEDRFVKLKWQHCDGSHTMFTPSCKGQLDSKQVPALKHNYWGPHTHQNSINIKGLKLKVGWSHPFLISHDYDGFNESP